MKREPLSCSVAAVAGFTLLELLVSAAMIGVIMMIMLTATSTSMAIWRNSERAIAVDREGRNAITLMADDFANMLPVAENAPDYMQPQLGVWNDYVFAEFFVLRPRDYQKEGAGNDGDVCYVRYRYKDQKIERAASDSEETFGAIKNGGVPKPANFEILSENLPRFSINTYNSLGERLDPENKKDHRKLVRYAGISLGSIDENEARNLEKGVELKDGLDDEGTSAELLSSIQNFSNFFEIARPGS